MAVHTHTHTHTGGIFTNKKIILKIYNVRHMKLLVSMNIIIFKEERG